MSRQHIVGKTLGEFRSFLDELVNGTSRYRSLHNLTEQVEHQYHDRFLVELLQNAHDALLSEVGTDQRQRIAIAYEEDEADYGALYVANDGKPLTASNFNAICNLGQSDKDPQESIGNKGIGFRSVLEITTEPHIYSKRELNSEDFDGYCFRFNPNTIDAFGTSLEQLTNGEHGVASPIGEDEPLCRWDEERFADFQRQFGGANAERLRGELSFLSPYVMPIPLDSHDFTSRVLDLQRLGFSTVVRLPLRSQKAKSAVIDRIA